MSRLDGAPQLVGRQGAPAADAGGGGGGGGGHGGEWSLCDEPVRVPHQTPSLLTHRYSDKSDRPTLTGFIPLAHLPSTPFTPPAATDGRAAAAAIST